jgi:hypothetical protein
MTSGMAQETMPLVFLFRRLFRDWAKYSSIQVVQALSVSGTGYGEVVC